MKKLQSISLIALILLNTMGYYAIFVGLQFKNDVALIQRLDDNQYDESRAVTLKIPISIPYLQDQTEFERQDGTFNYQGEYYRIIKQKYASDTLTIICFKDNESKAIQSALSDYVKTFTDNPQQDGSHAKISVTFIKDYIAQDFSIGQSASGWLSEQHYKSCTLLLQESFANSINHPPETV